MSASMQESSKATAEASSEEDQKDEGSALANVLSVFAAAPDEEAKCTRVSMRDYIKEMR